MKWLWRHRVGLALLAVLGTVAGGVVGYWLIGGGKWKLFDCLYMTIITLTTVGYGEVLPLETTTMGRPFTIALLMAGVLSVGYFVSSATAFLVEGELSGLRWRKRMQKELAKLENHVIVCGAGSTGLHAIRELAAVGADFVVVEHNEDLAKRIHKEFGGVAVVGDATHDDTLLQAGIERARGIIAALSDDKENLFVTLTARTLNGKLRIVAKAVEPKADQKMRRAGADSVVSPNLIGGLRMVSEMLRPEVTSFLDLMLRDKDRTLRIEEIAVPPRSSLLGKRVADADLQRHELLLLAVKEPPAAGGRYSYNPRPDHVIQEGATLIVLGEPEKVRRLSAEAGPR